MDRYCLSAIGGNGGLRLDFVAAPSYLSTSPQARLSVSSNSRHQLPPPPHYSQVSEPWVLVDGAWNRWDRVR